MPIQFNRAASSYLRPPGNALVANPAGTWTISVWIAPQVESGSVRNVFYLNPGNVLQLGGATAQFIYGGGISTIGAVAAWTGSQYGPWTHLAVAKNGAAEVRYYLNGVYVANRTAGISADAAQSASVGAYGRTSDFYAGHMAALKAWDRVLTDAEIDAESKGLLPARLAGLAGAFPFLTGPAIWRDWNGQAAELVSVSVGSSPVGISLPFGAPGQVVGRRDLSVQTVFVDAPAELGGASIGEVVIDGGRLLDWPLVEMAVNEGVEGDFARLAPVTRIRSVSGSFGFKSHKTYLSDSARAEVELINDDGAYTDGGGLLVGQWAKLRLAGSGELLFTGRIADIAPGYSRRSPYVRVRLDTLRNDLSIPARSVLLKDTNTRDAALALTASLPLGLPAGELIWDYSNWDEATWGGGSTAVRTFGENWIGLAAAGGYGTTGGDLDVLNALAELMAAEDGRALWARDNQLELYSRERLDGARDGAPAFTLTDAEITNMDFRLGADYANDVTVRWTPTRWQAGATVYTYEPDTPVSIKPGESHEFNVRFRVEGSDRVLAAENPVVVITQTGPTVAYTWDGEVQASGGALKATNPDSASAASVSKISITATALIANDATDERRSAVLDQTLYGLRAYQVNAPLLDRAVEATARADREFLMWNDRAPAASRVELRPRTRAEAVQWMTLPFATPLDVQSDRMKHAARYLAIGVDWSVAAGGWPADVTLFLEPVRVGGLLRWDDESGRGLWDSGRWA